MTHLSEAEFRVEVREWFEAQYGVSSVETDVYQSEPYWFVDLIVETGPLTLYIEVENDADSIRHGTGQALGYAADHDHGVPMVVVPEGHVNEPDVQRLRASQAAIIRGFDAGTGAWV